MRDINRIRPFWDKVAEVWERYPDLRFGQFVIDVVPDSDRLWNCEEDGFLEYLEAFDSGIRANRNSDKAKEKSLKIIGNFQCSNHFKGGRRWLEETYTTKFGR